MKLQSRIYCLMNEWMTFSRPRTMVMALNTTWNAAKKKIKICSWCKPSVETSDTFPCKMGGLLINYIGYWVLGIGYWIEWNGIWIVHTCGQEDPPPPPDKNLLFIIESTDIPFHNKCLVGADPCSATGVSFSAVGWLPCSPAGGAWPAKNVVVSSRHGNMVSASFTGMHIFAM